MKKTLLSTALLAAALLCTQSAFADEHHDADHGRQDKLTIAVFGDWPYNQNLLTNAPLLLNSVNSDHDVSLVIHVGDIHSGKMAEGMRGGGRSRHRTGLPCQIPC